MGIIGLMSSELKMGSRFPGGARLLYEGHSLHIAAVSNSPAAQIPFTAKAIAVTLFVACVCASVCVCVILNEARSTETCTITRDNICL